MIVAKIPRLLPVLSVIITVEFAQYGIVDIIKNISHEETTNFLEVLPTIGCLVKVNEVFWYFKYTGRAIAHIVGVAPWWLTEIDSQQLKRVTTIKTSKLRDVGTWLIASHISFLQMLAVFKRISSDARFTMTVGNTEGS